MSRHACTESRLQTVTTGVIFLTSGIALLTRARGWWQLENESAYWPIGFVIPGILTLVAPRPQRSSTTPTKASTAKSRSTATYRQ